MIEKAVTVAVYPEEDYYFEVMVAAEELNIVCREKDGLATQQVSFGSREEMRAVAGAILQALDVPL